MSGFSTRPDDIRRPKEIRLQPLADIGVARLALNNFVSAGFTANTELIVFRHETVGEFYNSAFGPIPLTIVIGLKARVNPVGMGIA